ncbi:MAG: hypothetical protein RMK74_02145 [Myxococcales bacterium]|nr:hypothetical protein [Myxococcales bacterium]
MRSTLLWASVAALFALACGQPPPPRIAREEDLRVLGEGPALALAREVASEQGVACSAGWAIDIGAQDPERRFEVDLRLEGTHFGIEWVTAQDRAEWGELIPRPDRTGALRILAGARDDARAQVLVLDESSYRYDPDPERVRMGSVGPREAEERLRRDVRDFLEYVRSRDASTQP